jgi:glycosyltransferase involved in cell wall biosynthesis
MAEAFPGATIWTTLYDANGTFPEFAHCRIRTSLLDRLPGARSHHRLTLPLLAPATWSMRVDAEVTICSSSGWAHGVRASGRKVVYCHTPARWLYQSERYLAGMPAPARPALALLGPALRRWDRQAATSADRYLVNSRAVAERVRRWYHRDAEILPPPVRVDLDAPVQEVPGVEPGFVLAVGRLLSYKNLGSIVAAFERLPHRQLVVAGDGPDRAALTAETPGNVRFLGAVDDVELRWLYRHCAAVVSASHEDFGLTPIEAAAHGKPAALLRWGGFLDTLIEGETGYYFDQPEPGLIAAAVETVLRQSWSTSRLIEHAAQYRPERFIARLRELVEDERRR